MHDVLRSACELKAGDEMHHKAVDKLDAVLLDNPVFTELSIAILGSRALPLMAPRFRLDASELY